MKRLLAYVSGILALGLVATAAIAALVRAATYFSETIVQLATSTLQGIGVAIGGCLGSALILRFKAARRFLRGVIRELNQDR